MTGKLTNLSAGERQKLLARARRQKEEAAKSKAEEGRKRGAYQRIAFDLQQAEVRERLIARCKETGLIPVSLGDLRGPDGNVFNVIGSVRNGISWARAAGLTIPTEVEQIVNGFTGRTYGETLEMIESYCLDVQGSIFAFRAAMGDNAGDLPDSIENEKLLKEWGQSTRQ